MLQARPVMLDDVEFLWTMLIFAARVDERPAAAESIRDRYLRGWGREGDSGVVAEEGDRSVGAAWLRLPTPDETRSFAFVASDAPELAIAVQSDRTGQGVGSFLLGHLLEQADRREVPAVVLSVHSDNAAVRLYHRFGFVEANRTVNTLGSSSLKMIRQRRQ